MAWASTSKTLIFKHLQLEFSQFNSSLIDARQSDVLTHGGQSAVDVIEGYLSTLETLETSLQDNAEDAAIEVLGIGSGIKYFPGGVRSGVQSEMSRLKKQIAVLMNLTPEALEGLPTGANGWGGGRIVRG